MANPTPYVRGFSFTAEQASKPTTKTPGDRLDNELENIEASIGSVIGGLADVRRSDGKIAAGSVDRRALASDVQLGLKAARVWAAGTTYLADDTVTQTRILYVCLAAHNSSVFADDFLAGKWQAMADLTLAVAVEDGSISTEKYLDKSVTGPKLGDGAVSARALAAGAVKRANADVSLGAFPVGGEIAFAGVDAPAGWLLCSGQAVSRSTYADLLQAITLTVTASGSSGAAQLTGLSRALTNIGVRNAWIEGPGIPAGTLTGSDAPGQLGLSKALTTSVVNGTFRLFPRGNGDGSTTFNVPDRRGFVTAGRDDMGGTPSGRLAAPGFDPGNLSTTGGTALRALINAFLPVTLPGGSVTVSYPPHQYVTVDSDSASASAGAGGVVVSNIDQGVRNAATTAPGNQSFSVSVSNPGGGQPFSIIQPTAIENKIIFAGV